MLNSHCPLDLWAPGVRSKGENVAFSTFAFKRQMIEDFIKYLASMPDPNNGNYRHQAEILSGLSLDDCSEKEIEYIEREVARRWSG